MKYYTIAFLFLLGLFFVTGCPPDIKGHCDANEECIDGYLCNKEKQCIEVEQEKLQITVENNPVGIIGEDYDITLFVQGGLKPYLLNINTVPEWLSYDEQSSDGFFNLYGVSNEQMTEVTVELEVTDNTIGEGQKVIKDLSLTVVPSGCDPIVFSDSAIEAVVRQKIGKAEGDILYDDIVNLTELVVRESEIIDIGGIQCLTSLTDLDLYRNEIIDISVLANLTNLTDLSLGDNQIIDISVLANLTGLTHLYLDGNSFSDVSFLSNLTNLTWLSLDGDSISDVSALANLTNLTGLNLWGNQIINISPLADLTNLTWLALANNQIIDISVLANMINLKELYIYFNQISDIGPLVDNTGINSGDIVDITDNPQLNCTDPDQADNIAALRTRGVVLSTDCP